MLAANPPTSKVSTPEVNHFVSVTFVFNAPIMKRDMPVNTIEIVNVELDNKFDMGAKTNANNGMNPIIKNEMKVINPDLKGVFSSLVKPSSSFIITSTHLDFFEVITLTTFSNKDPVKPFSW